MAEKKRIEYLRMYDVPGNVIMWKNFSGRKSEFNKDGKRSFHLVLEPEYAEQLQAEGWNIKWPKEQNEDNSLKPLLPVFLRFDVVPPTVWMISNGSKIQLDEDTIAELDASYIEKIDLVISPYQWEFNGKSGVKAYVRSMAAVMEEDPIFSKYSDLPDRTNRKEPQNNEPLPWE